jgi:protein phosphatase
MIEFGHLTHPGMRRELNEDTYYGDSELALWLVADGMGGHACGEVASALARETIVREIRRGAPLAQAIRTADEDTYYGDSELALWLVADGMGGHACGEVASALARETIVREIRRGAPLAQAIRTADEEIIRASRRRNDTLPMGTTVVAARVQGNRYEVAWVGDSRAYLWRDGQLAQLSQDHSVVQELVAQGNLTAEQARAHPHRNVVTQALGVTDPAHLNVATTSGELRPGMQLLLCSDGLTEEVDDRGIARTLAFEDASAQECVDTLVAAALDGGGRDNISVILVRCH